MSKKWLTAQEIAVFMNCYDRSIRRRADRENWRSQNIKGNGGERKSFQVITLPPDVQTAYAESLGLSVDELHKEFAPTEMPTKKAVLANHSGRSVADAPIFTIETASAKKREVANVRMRLLKMWDDSGLSAEEFIAQYDDAIRKELDGKTICPATLYNWFKHYENHDVAGLLPRYKSKGGPGAKSLDKHTKDLIHFYYLHKNKPAIAKVIRLLEENDSIVATETVVRRFINEMIPQNVKDYFRRGEKYWKDHYLPYMPTDYSRYYGMQMSVYDHKTFDMACRIQNADGTWKRIRPYLTMCIDQRSRLIQGWCVDETASVVTLLRAERMKVEKYGCSDEAKMDNGKDMTSAWFTGDAWERQHGMQTDEKKHFSCIMDDLGTASHFTIPYHGQSKNIERNFGFVATEFDKSFDSYLGNNTSDRHDESRRYVGSFEGAGKVPIEALPTLDEVRELFAKYAEWYNTKWHHSGNGMNGRTPQQVFDETKRTRRDPILDSKYIWTRRVIKTVQRNGIKDNDIWYYNEAMIAGVTYELRISIDDIRIAYVFNLDGEYLYDAVSDFKSTGVREEDIRDVNKKRKAQKRKLDEYEDLLKEYRKDKPTQLEELRASKGNRAGTIILDADGGTEIPYEMLKVANGEPLINKIPKRKILLPTDPEVELLYAEG